VAEELRLHLAEDDAAAPAPDAARIPAMHRLPCGCRGIWLLTLPDNLLVLSACDSEVEASLFVRRINKEDLPERLDTAEAVRLFRAVQDLIGDGYRYRDLRSLLRLNEP
jgi:hypothetical protein